MPCPEYWDRSGHRCVWRRLDRHNWDHRPIHDSQRQIVEGWELGTCIYSSMQIWKLHWRPRRCLSMADIDAHGERHSLPKHLRQWRARRPRIPRAPVNSSQRGGFGDPVSQLLIRPFSNVNLVTALLTGSYPPNVSPFGTHLSWANDVPADTAPVFITTQTNQFVPIKAWENEILASSTNGSGTVWRLGHTYATNLSQYFSAANAVSSVSQDGKWFAWATDWDGMLGNTNLSSSSCIVGVNCRTDVFIVQLPLEPSTPTPATKSPNSGIAPPTNVKATVN